MKVGVTRIAKIVIENNKIRLNLVSKFYENTGTICMKHFFGKMVAGTYQFNESVTMINNALMEKCEPSIFGNIFCSKKIGHTTVQNNLLISCCYQRETEKHYIFVISKNVVTLQK